jgi:hypothetical protein
MSFEEAPISKIYLPLSKVILPLFSSQNQRSEQSISIETVLVCPAGIVTLLNPFSLLTGL